MEKASRLALGTAQLGMAYGVANRRGQPSPDEACQIVSTALDCGVKIFDTAQSYGQSESVLGRCFQSLGVRGGQVKVISKLDPELNYHDPSCLRESVLASLDRLGLDSLYGLMLHRASWLAEWDKGLGESLAELKKQRLTTFLGVSVYTPQEALNALAIEGIDLIQAPFNIFDRRLLCSGALEQTQESGKQLFVRSIFLQGLILIPKESLQEHLSFARPALARLEAFCSEYRLNRQEFALGYAWQRTDEAAAILVIGAESAEQVREDIELVLERASRLDPRILDAWDALELKVPQKLIHPPLWG
ncbi:MAG: aldo/keto reductase [bacterium]|nr:aldo/keto reductase [bacterium]